MSFFDIVNELTASKEYAYSEEKDKDIDVYMINLAMSNFYDCIMHANVMNGFPDISKRMLYDYYHFAIQPKKKRFAPWPKQKQDADVKLISDFYACNLNLAEQYLKLLTPEQVEEIRTKMDTGGRRK